VNNIPRKIDYNELWRAGKAERAPKASIIGSLQKLLNEKEDDIITLNAQLEGLKERIEEYNDIMEQMETQFVKQSNEIKQLKGSGGSSSDYITPSDDDLGGGSRDKEKIKQLSERLQEMENKLYIFSNLPTRITDLEEKLEKSNRSIDNYSETQEKLKNTIRKLSTEGGSEQMINEMQAKIIAQKKVIEKLQGTPGGSAPISNNSGEVNQLKSQLITLTDEKNSYMTRVNQLQMEIAQLEKNFEQTRQTMASMQSNNSGEAELHAKINILQAEVESKDVFIQKLKTKPVSKPAVPIKPRSILSPAAPKIRAIDTSGSKEEIAKLTKQIIGLQEQVSSKNNEVSQITAELNNSQEQIAELKKSSGATSNVSDLMNDLQKKIKKLNAKLKKKDEEISSLKK
jgi:chromosome segregation ATPase